MPVPLLLIWAPHWGWVVAANVLLGINQGLTWSTTVIMKIDLVGPARRGLAMGLNEAAGYGAVAVTAAGHRLPRRRVRAAAGAVPARPRLRRPRPAAVRRVRPRDPRPRPPRGRQHTPAPTAHDHLHGELTGRQIFTHTSFTRARAVRGQPGRAGQQPQRRPRLGPVPDPVRHRRPRRRPDRRPRRALPRRVGRRPAGHRRAVGPVGRKCLITAGMSSRPPRSR